MANKKISELVALSTIEDADIMPIVETSEGETKSVLASVLKTYTQGTLPTTKLSLDQTIPQTITNGQPIQDTLTANQLVSTDANKKLQSLAVETYPSLTELAYVKGVTSAIQTQLTASLNYKGSITASNDFNTYITTGIYLYGGGASTNKPPHYGVIAIFRVDVYVYQLCLADGYLDSRISYNSGSSWTAWKTVSLA